MPTMTDAERAIMRYHQMYWGRLAEKGWAVAYGPVMEPAGGFGAGIRALPDEIDPRSLTNEDPAIKSKNGFRCDISPMPALVIGKAEQQ